MRGRAPVDWRLGAAVAVAIPLALGAGMLRVSRAARAEQTAPPTERLLSLAITLPGNAPDRAFTEFPGSLGLLRRKTGDAKPAFGELRKQALRRGWATVE